MGFRKVGLLFVAAALAVASAGWYMTMPQVVPASELPARTADIGNGRTVFNAGGCASCHATPAKEGQPRDPTRLGGGVAIKSPFGTFYGLNISQDKDSGIGAMTEAEFVTAVKKGTANWGEHLFPSFPYASYARITTDDVRDLYAYLKTLPAVPGQAPDHELSFPFNQRRLVGLWKLLFFDDSEYRPNPNETPEWNRGAYLVNGPGHCAECHSPRNFLGGIVSRQRFAGGPNPAGQGSIPNITQKRLASWSVKDFADFLDSGMTPDGDTTGGEMAEVVRNMHNLPAADRQAMAVYLKSLPPVDGPPPRK